MNCIYKLACHTVQPSATLRVQLASVASGSKSIWSMSSGCCVSFCSHLAIESYNISALHRIASDHPLNWPRRGPFHAFQFQCRSYAFCVDHRPPSAWTSFECSGIINWTSSCCSVPPLVLSNYVSALRCTGSTANKIMSRKYGNLKLMCCCWLQN